MAWQSRHTVLVDTNILLLLVVGSTDPSKVGAMSRTKQYSVEDYRAASSIVEAFRWTVTTPHVLSQTSDLLRGSGAYGELAHALSQKLKAVFIVTQEHFVPARVLARPLEFHSVGLADASVLDAAHRGCTIFTDDLPLHNVILSRGGKSINFTEWRFPE
jgi:hypothetical protein